jgi:tRNA dimethylallyltransferase
LRATPPENWTAGCIADARKVPDKVRIRQPSTATGYNEQVMQAQNLPPLIAIFGPTASGKSALAMKLGEELGGEIVSADSRQVYRYMDIGTDKASPADRARVPHHMIDIVDPDEAFSLALYQEGAYSAIDDILARGSVPILAGGTPLYVNAVVEGWVIPKVEPDPALRQSLEEEAARSGVETLYRRLVELDPLAAEKILPTNTRRIIRALEVILTTGEKMSAQQSREAPPYRMLKILLETERASLLRRIDARVDSYIERGLVEEVAGLHAMGYSFDLPSMSGIGYRQIGDYLLGRATLSDAVQRVKWDTHAFTRHQANWFKRSTDAHRIDATERDPFPEALPLTRQFLEDANT